MAGDAQPGDHGPDSVFAGPIALPPLVRPGEDGFDRAFWRDRLARCLYGAIPPAPDAITVTRHPIDGESAERLRIEIAVGTRRFAVDAALWLPENAISSAAGPKSEPKSGRVPLICGLDFVGPAGVMPSTGFPLDPQAVIYTRPEWGAQGGRMDPVLRGTSACHWPVSVLLNAGMAVMVSCYGSWVPDSADHWQGHGVYPLLNCAEDFAHSGAIALWAWAILRLLDTAGTLGEIDAGRMYVAGHSRLGKAALWAAAQDSRIAAGFANNSGCAGAAPAAHPVGETLEQMATAYPHWLIQGRDPGAADLDQHHLLALIAPRKTYIGCARDDLWADPAGSYLALRAASGGKWPMPCEALTGRQIKCGPSGYHLRPGGHNLLPWDWHQFLAFLHG